MNQLLTTVSSNKVTVKNKRKKERKTGKIERKKPREKVAKIQAPDGI